MEERTVTTCVTKFFAPLVISDPFKILRHVEQVSNQRQFFWTWREWQTVNGSVATTLEEKAKNKRKQEGSAPSEKGVELNHLSVWKGDFNAND
jgi:hypothetical protein